MDNNQCPTCKRDLSRLNSTSADRHIQSCAEKKRNESKSKSTNSTKRKCDQH